MELSNKLNFFLNAAKDSDAAYFNGNLCLFNERDSFEDDNVSTIYFDTYDGDDFYTCIKVETIKDIELKDGIFLIKTSGGVNTVSFLYVKKFNF